MSTDYFCYFELQNALIGAFILSKKVKVPIHIIFDKKTQLYHLDDTENAHTFIFNYESNIAVVSAEKE